MKKFVLSEPKETIPGKYSFWLHADNQLIDYIIRNAEGIETIVGSGNHPSFQDAAIIHVDSRFDYQDVWLQIHELCDGFVIIDKIWEF